MRHCPPSSRVPFASSAVAPLLAALLALSMSSQVHAESASPVLIWGIARGCTPLRDVNRDLEKALFAQHPGTRLLQSPGGQALSPCIGAECAQRLAAACSGLQRGRLLGGQVQTHHGLTQTRLWLHDLATGQTAYADDYCESCGVQTAVNTHALHLLAEPRFGGERPKAFSQPAYCVPENVGSQPQGSVLLTVTGEGRGKQAVSAVHEAIRQQLTLRGHTLLPLPADSRTLSVTELQRIVEAQPGAQLVAIQLPRDGHSQAQILLFDQRSALGNQKMIPCPDCAGDRELLITRLKTEVAALLDYCYGASCADPRHRPHGTQPSANACEPYPKDAACQQEPARAAPLPAPSLATPIDPKLARTLKALTWGLTAATTATSVALFALSGTGAGDHRAASRTELSYLLDPAAWAMAGSSLALIGISVPITLLLNRATPTENPVPSSAHAITEVPIQCPN